MIDRCPTGIPGFDQVSRGGYVRNSDNLVVGGPGSGKTTFLLQFLWNGVTQFNENGLYISFEPDIVDILNDAMAYGWDFTKLSNEGRIKFMKFAPETSIDELRSQLRKIIARNDIKRICFDPVSILAMNLGDQGKIRKRVFELSSLMKRLRVTTLYADESMESEGIERRGEGGWTRTDVLRFLSDSVTILYDYSVTGIGDRALRILKMRRTSHERKIIGMEIKDYGIDVEYDDKQPSHRESYPVVEPSALVFGKDPSRLANAPISNPSSVNSLSKVDQVSKVEQKEQGIGTVPMIPETKLSNEVLLQQKPSPAPVNDSPNQFSSGSSKNNIAYAPAAIPPRPLSAASRALVPQAKKEQTVFRARVQTLKPLQRSLSAPRETVSSSSVENDISQKKKDGYGKVDWID